MSRYKPTAHSLPARIVLIGATIAIVGALFGTAAVADAVSTPAPKITEALQPGQTVSDIAPGGGDASFGGPTSGTPASGPASAPQPGQTGW
jgi:hypothetical protein